MNAPEPPLSFATRLWLSWLVFFKVLFDGEFAARVLAVREAPPELPPATKPSKPSPSTSTSTSALQLLALLQREGRLVDFLEQDVATFSDADVGAAARVVHEGCRKALHAHAQIEPVRAEEEGAKLELASGFSPSEIKLVGNVQGSGPYKGVLRHRGWRAKKLSLPVPVDGHDASVLAPAEVEL